MPFVAGGNVPRIDLLALVFSTLTVLATFAAIVHRAGQRPGPGSIDLDEGTAGHLLLCRLGLGGRAVSSRSPTTMWATEITACPDPGRAPPV